MAVEMMMMFCPTCDETISPAAALNCQDGMCLTCGDRLITQSDGTAVQSQRRQQHQLPAGGGGGDNDPTVAMDAAISAILASELSGANNFLDPSIISAFDNPITAAEAAATNMTLPTMTMAMANGTTNAHRPASQKALDNLKREVLTAKSAELLETQVELFEPCRVDEMGAAITSHSTTTSVGAGRRLTFDAIPGEFTHELLDNHHHTINSTIHTATSDTPTTPTNKAHVTTPHHHHHRTSAALVLCTPRTTKGGQLSSQTQSEISSLRKHGIPFIAYVTRGDNITFVQKALVCQRAGMVSSQQQQPSNSNSTNPSASTTTSRCIGVIVGNATSPSTGSGGGDEVWPYIMQDPKKEAQQFGLTVPVVMIRRDDGRRLVQWATTTSSITSKNDGQDNDTMQQLQNDNSSSNSSINDNNNYYYTTPCRIIIRNKDSESNSCPVCADPFAIGDTIVRLPNCGHVFHENCALMWLTKHNTCPYCRSEMATEDEEYESERRRRQMLRNEDDEILNGNGHANFYG
jgi:hypothetical protein